MYRDNKQPQRKEGSEDRFNFGMPPTPNTSSDSVEPSSPKKRSFFKSLIRGSNGQDKQTPAPTKDTSDSEAIKKAQKNRDKMDPPIAQGQTRVNGANNTLTRVSDLPRRLEVVERLPQAKEPESPEPDRETPASESSPSRSPRRRFLKMIAGIAGVTVAGGGALRFLGKSTPEVRPLPAPPTPDRLAGLPIFPRIEIPEPNLEAGEKRTWEDMNWDLRRLLEESLPKTRDNLKAMLSKGVLNTDPGSVRIKLDAKNRQPQPPEVIEAYARTTTAGGRPLIEKMRLIPSDITANPDILAMIDLTNKWALDDRPDTYLSITSKKSFKGQPSLMSDGFPEWMAMSGILSPEVASKIKMEKGVAVSRPGDPDRIRTEVLQGEHVAEGKTLTVQSYPGGLILMSLVHNK